jgi:hypothetical protein
MKGTGSWLDITFAMLLYKKPIAFPMEKREE